MNEQVEENRSGKIRRQRVKYRHANPLFDAWLQDWQEQAKQADSNMRFIFSKARKSLSLFPLPVYSGTDCKVLQYFGDKICSMIDRKIAKYEQEFGPIDWDKHIQVLRSKPKTPKSAKKTVTTTRRISASKSSANRYLLTDSNKFKAAAPPSPDPNIVSLSSHRPPVGSADPSLASATIRPPTAKRAKPMPSRARVAKVPRTTNLSTKEAAAVKVPSSVASIPRVTDHESQDAAILDDTSSSSSDAVLFTLAADSYEVLLCVDLAETTSKSSKEGIVRELAQHGVVHDIRKLHVGDFAWVARETQPAHGKKPRELVLPFIVERKRMDDLASSIKDGRCREQKHRLLQCGLATAVYLVEMTGQHHAGLPLPTCYQALANTAVVDGLLVKWTADFRESAAYLTLLTRLIQTTYRGRTLSAVPTSTSSSRLPGCTALPEFNAFNVSLVKNRQLSVQEMLAKHLLQLAGLSLQKVAAIVKEVSSLSGLVSLVSTPEGVSRLAELRAVRSGRPVGQAAAAAIAALYTQRVLH